MLNYSIEGGKQVEEALKALGSKVAKSISNKALRQGANILKEEMKAQVPVRSGALKKSIKVKKNSFDRDTKAQTYTIGPTGKVAFIARFIEYGTSTHKIKVGKMRVLANSKSGQIFGKEINHPGLKPKPFIRPAFDSKKGTAVDKVTEVIRSEVNNFKGK